MFQGLVTSADSVYLLNPVEDIDAIHAKVYSNETGKEYVLETDVVHPLCKGSRDVRRYRVSTSKRVLFPYDARQSAESGRATLIGPDEFAASYPSAWKYLLENRRLLENRENGKMRHAGWYGYVYPKSVALFGRRKLLTPSIAKRASFTLDKAGEYYFVGSGGGGGGGYGILLQGDCGLSDSYVLGLLNSSLLDWYLQRIASRFRGGYFAYNRQYISLLPIVSSFVGDAGNQQSHNAIVELVRRVLDLSGEVSRKEPSHERTALQRQIDAADREIDQLVYELYGLTDEEVRIVEEATR